MVFVSVSKVSLLLLVFLAISRAQEQDTSSPLSTYEVVFGWSQLDFAFQSEEIRNDKIGNKEFIPLNNVITGIKLADKRMFLSVPRWRPGVPATLVYVDHNPKNTITMNPDLSITSATSPRLIPYPSWEMQTIGYCHALQYVQSMEIDQFHRMWVLDVGRINIFSEADNKCPPKLVLIDLSTNQVEHTYVFPEEVVNRTNSFLNDLVVGCETPNDCFVYISDAADAKVIVYNFKLERSWAVFHASMLAENLAKNFTILDQKYVFDTQVDGIALSPIDSKFDTLYYCPLSSFNLYSVPTASLQREPASNNNPLIMLQDADVTLIGTKSSQSDGMTTDFKGLLFYGMLANNSINFWNTTGGKLNASDGNLVVQNNIDLQWPDTFGFDSFGHLYATTNRLQRYSVDTLDPKDKNFRVVRVFIGSRSYMHSASDSIDPLTYQAGVTSTTTSSTTPEPMTSPNPTSATPSTARPEQTHNGNVKLGAGSEYQYVGRESGTGRPSADYSSTTENSNVQPSSNLGTTNSPTHAGSTPLLVPTLQIAVIASFVIWFRNLF